MIRYKMLQDALFMNVIINEEVLDAKKLMHESSWFAEYVNNRKPLPVLGVSDIARQRIQMYSNTAKAWGDYDSDKYAIELTELCNNYSNVINQYNGMLRAESIPFIEMIHILDSVDESSYALLSKLSEADQYYQRKVWADWRSLRYFCIVANIS